jgi:hypothetical protein
MSALGHKGKARPEHLLSAILPKADFARSLRDVSFMPRADIGCPTRRHQFSYRIQQHSQAHAEVLPDYPPGRSLSSIDKGRPKSSWEGSQAS